jgi:predicted kinase
MDLEFLGNKDLADYLIDRYAEVSGDEGLRTVLDFYVSYRACVRAKVDGIKLQQPETGAEERGVLRRRLTRYFELAHLHTLSIQEPLLILTGGLSGTGKSTLARGLAETLGAPLFRSDEVRQELFGVAPSGRKSETFGGGIYTEESTRRTYQALADRAAEALQEGASVIVDATFSRREQRRLLRETARQAGASVVQFECRLPWELARERMRRRAEEGRDASAATPAIQDAQAAAYEPFAAEEKATSLDTSPSPEIVLEAAISAVRARVIEGRTPQTRS